MSGAVPRVLALLAAIGLIVGALAIRNRIDDDNGGAGGDGGGDLRLTCTPELETVCERLPDEAGGITVTIEEAGVTADRLLDANRAEIDGWLTPGPWPQMVREVRASQGKPRLITNVSERLARSPVVLVAWRDRAAALVPRCPDRQVEVPCVGAAAGKPWRDVGGSEIWGEVKTAIPAPPTSATGLAVLGAATAQLFGTTDVSSTDLERDDFAAMVEALRRANRTTTVERMLAAGPGDVDVVAALEVTARPLVSASARRTEVQLAYPEPVISADVVLGTAGSRARRLVELLSGQPTQELFEAMGWRTSDRPPVSGLPSPGLLFALRQRWAQ